MKAKLTFDLDDPDDRMAHLRAVKATDMACVLFEISANLYKKFSDKTVDELFVEIENLYSEHGINMEELIR